MTRTLYALGARLHGSDLGLQVGDDLWQRRADDRVVERRHEQRVGLAAACCAAVERLEAREGEEFALLRVSLVRHELPRARVELAQGGSDSLEGGS